MTDFIEKGKYKVSILNLKKKKIRQKFHLCYS